MKRRKYRTQEPPYSISFELTQGCSIHCPFCAMPAIQDKPGRGYKFMDKATIVKVCRDMKELRWNSRIGFAMRGEPTMHPDYVGMVAAVRECLPKAHMLMLTNASGLLRKPGPVANVQALFAAGLNTLGLDDYANVKFVSKVTEALSERAPLKNAEEHPSGFVFYDYPEDLAGNPHMRRPRDVKVLVRVRDLSEQEKDRKRGNHSRVSNHAGLAFPPDSSMHGKRCHNPFRQFVVHSDGNVPLCCNTWTSNYYIGNVLESHVGDLWQSDAFGAAREMLIMGKREAIKTCSGCNHRSYRVGLLPDSRGKGKMHRPDEQTRMDIETALSHGDHTPLVRIPWKERPNIKENAL
jgi:radical SAM protein with 4Fe4S-binding SPASM domain